MVPRGAVPVNPESLDQADPWLYVEDSGDVVLRLEEKYVPHGTAPQR
jgi:hypothetical protein